MLLTAGAPRPARADAMDPGPGSTAPVLGPARRRRPLEHPPAGTDGARGAFTSPRPIHYQLDRCVTVREMARLHGFPDWVRLHSTKWHGARQIGNAVAPPLARAIAAKVIEALGVQPERPEGAVDVGDPALLRREMTGAAEHFGVAAPNGRRDRKSGAKKRKQHEIEEAREALRLAANG